MSGGQDWASEFFDRTQSERRFKCPRCGGEDYEVLHNGSVMCWNDKSGDPRDMDGEGDDACCWCGDKSECGLE